MGSGRNCWTRLTRACARCRRRRPLEIYTGVLFKRLELPELSAAARRRVLIASALWGVVRPDDRIPYYKFPPKIRLKGIGAPNAFWRPALAAALPDKEGELVVDMRSGAYAAAWKPKRATLLAVRAFTETGGQRKAVSHMAKAVRGDVARALLKAKKVPRDPESAAAIAEAAGFTVELSDGTWTSSSRSPGPASSPDRPDRCGAG